MAPVEGISKIHPSLPESLPPRKHNTGKQTFHEKVLAVLAQRQLLLAPGQPASLGPEVSREGTGASPAAGARSLRQAYECWKAKADPIEWAKEHREFARAFDSFPQDADALYPGWREQLAGVHR